MRYEAKRERVKGVPVHSHLPAVIVSALAAAIAGAIIGYFTAVGWTGAIIGGIVGVVAGFALAEGVILYHKRKDARDLELDREIGVLGGDIGAPRESLTGIRQRAR